MSQSPGKLIFRNPTLGSPGAVPAPEFIIIHSAAPGTAYAVKPLVGVPVVFPLFRIIELFQSFGEGNRIGLPSSLFLPRFFPVSR